MVVLQKTIWGGGGRELSAEFYTPRTEAMEPIWKLVETG